MFVGSLVRRPYHVMILLGRWRHLQQQNIGLLLFTAKSIQEAQLPQRNSASAATWRGEGPPAHSPSSPSGYIYAQCC